MAGRYGPPLGVGVLVLQASGLRRIASQWLLD